MKLALSPKAQPKKTQKREAVLNSAPIVRQYDILNNDWGVFMPKGVPKKRYTAEFKQKVVEAVLREGLSYKEACIQKWERIYLEEGPEGLGVERRGRGSTGRPKELPPKVEEDLLVILLSILRPSLLNILITTQQGKAEGPAACSSQATSPLGCVI